MHSNRVQNQSKVSAYLAEEFRIQPVKCLSPWEGQLINKTASFQKEAMRTQVALQLSYGVKFV